MISKEKFLPKFPDLTSEQRQALAAQVLAYQKDVLPLFANVSDPWDNDTVEAFDQGLVMISTLTRARDFCRAAYQYREGFKRIKGFNSLFNMLIDSLAKTGDIESDNSNSTLRGRHGRNVIGAKFVKPAMTGKQGRPQKVTGIPEVAPAGVQDQLLRPADGTDPLRPTIVERPRHLHDYIHMLPDELQTEASKIRDLYDEMDDEAHKLEQLCQSAEDGSIVGSQKDRAYHACKLCNLEDKIRNLWSRIDLAYAKATGKEVSTDYEKFLSEETQRINNDVREKELCEMTKFDIDSMEEGAAKEAAKAARIERDKKFLRKDDRQNIEEHRSNLMDAAKELHEWGIAITDSQVACCKKFGYDVPEEWIELPIEERRKLQQKARNEKRKQERAEARAEKQAKKIAEAEAAAAPYTSGDISLYTEE